MDLRLKFKTKFKEKKIQIWIVYVAPFRDIALKKIIAVKSSAL